MKKSLSSLIPIIVLALGLVALGFGLHKPVINLPVIGSVRYAETSQGGRDLATWMLVLGALGTTLVVFSGRARAAGLWIWGITLGLLAGNGFAVAKWVEDQLMMFGDDEGVQKILAKSTYGAGATWGGIGLALILIGLVWLMVARAPSGPGSAQ